MASADERGGAGTTGEPSEFDSLADARYVSGVHPTLEPSAIESWSASTTPGGPPFIAAADEAHGCLSGRGYRHLAPDVDGLWVTELFRQGLEFRESPHVIRVGAATT